MLRIGDLACHCHLPSCVTTQHLCTCKCNLLARVKVHWYVKASLFCFPLWSFFQQLVLWTGSVSNDDRNSTSRGMHAGGKCPVSLVHPQWLPLCLAWASHLKHWLPDHKISLVASWTHASLCWNVHQLCGFSPTLFQGSNSNVCYHDPKSTHHHFSPLYKECPLKPSPLAFGICPVERHTICPLIVPK